MGFGRIYLGGGWAVRAPDGQVRRRVVGEGLGEKVSFELFWGKSGKKRVNWRKIYVLLWGQSKEEHFFCILKGNL